MASIRTMDSFLNSYSVPSFLKEEPTNFTKALKEWQDIQGNYYKNDKARMELEDKEEQREKDKEREQKMLELGLTLDADDIQGSLRKVIDFSKGEGDINSAMSGIGRLYQLQERDKKKAETDLRRAMGISKKEQAKLEKEAQNRITAGYLNSGIGTNGFTPQGFQNGVFRAVQNGDLKAAKEIAALGKTFFGTGKKEATDPNLTTNGLMNNAKGNNEAQPQQNPIERNRIGDKRTNRRTGERQIFTVNGWETIG